jgi:hypothetical protein
MHSDLIPQSGHDSARIKLATKKEKQCKIMIDLAKEGNEGMPG